MRDLDIGGQFPDIKNLRVQNVELHDTGYLENVDLILNLFYEGNFRMAIEADMVLGKKGFLSVVGEWLIGLFPFLLLLMIPFICSETDQRNNALAIHPETVHTLVLEFHR